MFNYINSFNNIMHNIIANNKIANNKIVIDATLGNGHDTDFLKDNFETVYSLDSHENFKKHINEEVDCIVYNLGYLPGANKHITTKTDSTLKSIKEGLDLLSKNGMMFIAMYPGHEEGSREKDSILELAKNLNTKHFGVLYQEFINRPNNPPCLLIIEKK